MSSSPHVGLLAGEASGDQLGRGLIASLKEIVPSLVCSGIGGPAMTAAGFESRHAMDRLSVMGFIDPLKRLPELIRIRRDMLRYFLDVRPAVFVGIDSPDFNLGLEIPLREAGIPVVHYVSPSVWAWRQKRIHKIARATDLVLTLFPFEMEFYKKHNVPAQFVGHPLADQIPLDNDKKSARTQLGIDPEAVCLAILPGSRQSECRIMMPLFLAAAERCRKRHLKLCVISAASSGARLGELQQLCKTHAPDLHVQVFQQAAQTVMTAADAVLVTSGTATLETMLCGRPMVIAYQMSGWVYPLVRRLIKTPWIGLPNLLAGEKIVPEFIQTDATPQNLAEALLVFLESSVAAESLQARFKQLHQQLRCDANAEAARAVMTLMNKEQG